MGMFHCMFTSNTFKISIKTKQIDKGYKDGKFWGKLFFLINKPRGVEKMFLKVVGNEQKHKTAAKK